ncbi:MAG: aminoglycoside 6-adenylyltransferase [Butyrivibrio sp.]|nr:aminoglycoside 6-adenylyltransferase [Acetatifactor muris]MCM1560090.1 aminoglycoside 6-adenylyltransferase [Butyrivibrio sp.]
MRGEKEILDLILEIGERDERIRGAYMNGSRTNPNVPKDIFQDYDVVYVVGETESFIQDKSWIRQFGEILYMQLPDECPDEGTDISRSYGWLVQFADGVRIDLHVETVEKTLADGFPDSLTVILMDKDNRFPKLPESNDSGYHVRKPDGQRYACVCNEFWWCLNNVAKGLWRGEMPYVQDMVNFHVRKQLETMLSWKVGILTDFSVSVGKSGKYMYRWLDRKEWETYLSTWFSADLSEGWEAVFRMCDLFRQTAEYVGRELGYDYNAPEGANSRSYLEHVRSLPKDAAGVYSREQ